MNLKTNKIDLKTNKIDLKKLINKYNNIMTKLLTNIDKLLNLKILNIINNTEYNVEKKEKILNYIDTNLFNLKIKLELENNNIKNILLNLINTDTNFLIIHKSLKSIELYMKEKYNSKLTEDDINNIIIKYLEDNI